MTRVLVASLALQALAIALYLVARDLNTLYAVSMLFGFSYGGAMPLYAILVREHFPVRIMGSVFGLVSGIATVGMAIGPLMGGWVFDRSGGYGWLFVTSAVLGAVAFLVAMTVGRIGPGPWFSPRQPEATTRLQSSPAVTALGRIHARNVGATATPGGAGVRCRIARDD